jgi:hypothetical protein
MTSITWDSSRKTIAFLAAVIFCSSLFVPKYLKAQKAKAEVHYFPAKSYWQPLMLDPIAAQTNGSLNAYWEDGQQKEIVWAIFAFGFQRPLIKWLYPSGRSLELGMEVASFTQFEFRWVDGRSQRNILNTDFKVGIPLIYHAQKWTYRLRMFHVSSHWGDDYMIRNHIYHYIPNAVNYEQMDFTASYTKTFYRIYGGFGVVIRPETIRKRWDFEAGFFITKKIGKSHALAWIGGMDIKAYQQNNFNPGINAAIGIRMANREKHPFKLMLQYYHGNLPFGVYEARHVQWLGIGLYMNPW